MSDTRDDMQLPAGRTCGDCASFRSCKGLFGCAPGNTRCDWAPSRFMIKIDGQAALAAPLPRASDAALAEEAHVVERLSETLAEVYLTILGDDAPDSEGNAIDKVLKAAQVLRMEVDLYRAQAAQPSQAQAAEAQDAARYRWLRDHSEPGICAFYLSVGMAFKDVRFKPGTVDAAVDAQINAALSQQPAQEG